MSNKGSTNHDAPNHMVVLGSPKKLFTPGPLTVSDTVRAAAAVKDVGSRDNEFIQVVRSVRERLVQLAELPTDKYTAVLMQGSGTFAVESVLNTVSDRKAKILILSCGAYGHRMKLICEKARIPYEFISYPEDERVTVSQEILSKLADSSAGFVAVAIVHSETTSGVVNRIHEIGTQIKAVNSSLIYIVDAMSSFGATPECYATVDFLVSSANKCIQGIPGFGFAICNKVRLLECKGKSASLSLDLYEQWAGLESNGQFRFTPPTHSIMAFHRALKELEDEGGVQARFKRYQTNNQTIKDGMKAMGFKKLVADQHDGHIITSFHFPKHSNFKFEAFYEKLSEKGQVIYPGKVTNADCFRIGNIGHLFPEDMLHLLACIKQVLNEMQIPTQIS